jgi:hypothetical protein
MVVGGNSAREMLEFVHEAARLVLVFETKIELGEIRPPGRFENVVIHPKQVA